MRKFVIGDIHGCYDELMELIEKIELKDEDVLISLGDIVDRGNQSKEVYQFFANRPNSIVLMGNHERKHQNQILSYSQEIVKVQFGHEYPKFLNWLNTLPYYYETEEAIIVHAFFEHDIALEQQKEEVLCGSTAGSRYLEKKYSEGTYWSSYYLGHKPIIYGHHVVGNLPKIIKNTYGIDTGACHGNYLTAVELPGLVIYQVKAKKDYWLVEQKIWQIPVLKAKNWDEMQFDDIEKQINKLAYIEDLEVKAFLKDLSNWRNDLLDSFNTIKENIEKYTTSLIQQHGDDFKKVAGELSLKNFIFKSAKGMLTMEVLKKSLSTPKKVLEIQAQLK